jgi:cytolysin (calcineurin-like family phosphatase)
MKRNGISHTPGPWKVGEQRTGDDLPDPECDIFTEIMSGDGLIALVDATPVDDQSLEANARLIAAAPAMLEACRVASDGINTLVDLHGKYLSALAKKHVTDLQNLLERAIAQATREPHA